MSDTYTWKVNQLDRELSDDVVTTVHWGVTGTRPNSEEGAEAYSAYIYGADSFTADPSDPGFVPYEQLTEAECIGWVTDKKGEEEVTRMEESLSATLEEKENPTTGSGMPWS